MTRWEYKTLTDFEPGRAESAETLRQLGVEGWRVIGAWQDDIDSGHPDVSVTIMLMRPDPNQMAEDRKRGGCC